MGHWLLIRPTPRKNADGNDWLGGEVIVIREGSPDANPFNGREERKLLTTLYVDGLTKDDLAALADPAKARIDKAVLKAALAAPDAAKVEQAWRTDVATDDGSLPRLQRAAVVGAKTAKTAKTVEVSRG